MPTSTVAHITSALRHIITTSPKSVLDIGVGYGRWGYLCRETLDAAFEKFRPEDWRVTIDGIEIFEPYILDHQRFLYNNIYIGNAYDVIKERGEYDLIIAGDVIEHLEKEKALEVLDNIYERAQKGFILNLPIGEEWLRECEEHENKHEAHLSWWDFSDFEGLLYEANTFEMLNGSQYATIWFSETSLNYNRLIRKANKLLDAGDINAAVPSITELLEKFPEEISPYLLKIEVLLANKLLDEVYKTFDALLERIPHYEEGYITYLEILQKTGKTSLLQEKAEQFLKLDVPENIKGLIQKRVKEFNS